VGNQIAADALEDRSGPGPRSRLDFGDLRDNARALAPPRHVHDRVDRGTDLRAHGNVTYVMDRLERRGLVARYRSEDDRRVVNAELTREGRELVASVFPGHAEYVEMLCRHLDVSEQEELRAVLKRLGKGIAEEDLPK
jgi:hypothetical protein